MDLNSLALAIPGVGPASAKALEAHNIKTVRDILLFTPYRYIDFTNVEPIASARAGSKVVVAGAIVEAKSEYTSKRHMMLVRAVIEDRSGQISAVWFNQRFLLQTLKKGVMVHVYGEVGFDQKYGKTLRNPTLLFESLPRPVPMYSERSGIESRRFTRIVQKVIHATSQLSDPLPEQVQQKYELVSLPEAIKMAHAPVSMDEVAKATERLAVDELWTLMTVMRQAKARLSTEVAAAIREDTNQLQQDITVLPFKLTQSQNLALKDVLKDMVRPRPMRRLLNGDVGSGKTIVAFLAARQVLKHALKVVMLVPTTVLASQHYQSFRTLYPETPSFLFTSNQVFMNGQKVSRAEGIKHLTAAKQAFICGTHAVFHDDLELGEGVGLVIVDEQHRFGVAQRAHLFHKAKDTVPHLLSMSATPIPRTAALVLYGDLDISLLPEKPIGRIPIITKLASEKSRPLTYQFIDQLIEKGQQVFVVCPVIKPSEDEETDRLFSIDDRKAAVEEYEQLKQSVFAHRRIGLLHGKLKQEEKERTLAQFRNRELDILISTTVVEVGVDIPQATIMVVEGAEYFGLAQLHQLRGRVGRNDLQSYCFLFASHWSPHITYRLQLLVDYSDGFSLAEKDLELRGPGELYGTAQAGIEPFQHARIGNAHMVSLANAIANDIVAIPDNKQSVELKDWLEDHRHIVHRE